MLIMAFGNSDKIRFLRATAPPSFRQWSIKSFPPLYPAFFMLANRVEIAFFSPRHLSVGFNFPSLPSPMMRRPTSPTIFAIAGLTRPLFAKLCTDSRLNRMEVCFWYSKSSLQIDSNAVPFSTNSFILSIQVHNPMLLIV